MAMEGLNPETGENSVLFTNRVDASIPGTVTCLKCFKPFRSMDRLRLRICSICKSKREKDRCGLLAEGASSVHGIDLGFLEVSDYDLGGVPAPPADKPAWKPRVPSAVLDPAPIVLPALTLPPDALPTLVKRLISKPRARAKEDWGDLF